MKNLIILIGLSLLFACGSKESNNKKELSDNSKKQSDSTVKLIEGSEKGLIFQSTNSNSGMHLLEDSSMIIWHQRPDESFFKGIGYYSMQGDTMSLFQGKDLKSYSEISYTSGLSDSLIININSTVSLPTPRLVLFDTLVFNFIDNTIVVDKKKLKQVLAPNTIWEDFDRNFIVDIKILFGSDFVLLFQNEQTKMVQLDFKNEIPVKDPIKFMIWKKKDASLLLLKSGVLGVKMDTLKQNIF